MASTQSIAELRGRSITRLESGFAKLSEATGVKVPVIVTQSKGRDPMFDQAKLLETFANWMDAYIAEIMPETQEERVDAGNYGEFSNKELRAIADERGIDARALRSKAELIDALEAADGLTEDEQASLHSKDES